MDDRPPRKLPSSQRKRDPSNSTPTVAKALDSRFRGNDGHERVKTLRGRIHVKHGYPFKSEHFSDTGEFIVLTPGNFWEAGGFKQQAGKEKFYTAEFPAEYLHERGDLIVAMTEQSAGLLGSMAFVPESNRYLHNQRIGKVTTTSDDVQLAFLYYAFRMPSVRMQLSNTASGSKVRHTSPERIYDVSLPLPSVSDQEKIAAVLSAIDAKIELNNRINAELEALAKTIYDYWFVQFDFPDADGRPYKTSGGRMVWNDALKREIPANWTSGPLGKWLRFKRGISYRASEIGDTGTPLLNLNSFQLDGSVKLEGTKLYSGRFRDDQRVQPGDLVVAITDVTRNAEITGRSFVVPNLFDEDPLISCDVAAVCAPHLSAHYLDRLFNSEQYRSYIRPFASGTLVLHLNLDGVRWYESFLPPRELLEKFDSTASTIRGKINANLAENVELTGLRDWLLPLIMNGQVRVAL